MAKDFRHYCQLEHPKPGHAWLWAGPEKVVINLMTQEPARDEKSHPGKASAHNVGHALKELRRLIEKEGITSIALPRLATGVGGLEWSAVEPLIEQHLGDLNIPVIVYDTYKKNAKAPRKAVLKRTRLMQLCRKRECFPHHVISMPRPVISAPQRGAQSAVNKKAAPVSAAPYHPIARANAYFSGASRPPK
jgi:hypothetical protein